METMLTLMTVRIEFPPYCYVRYHLTHARIASTDDDLFQKIKSKSASTSTDHVDINRVAAEREVLSYVQYCKNIDEHQLSALLFTFPYCNLDELGKYDESKRFVFHPKVKKQLLNTNIRSLAMLFDVMEYWKVEGSIKFPTIGILAAITLAKPYTNAQQERDFSTATYFDGKLMQRQKTSTLEERFLCRVNRSVIKDLQIEIQESEKLLRIDLSSLDGASADNSNQHEELDATDNERDSEEEIEVTNDGDSIESDDE